MSVYQTRQDVIGSKCIIISIVRKLTIVDIQVIIKFTAVLVLFAMILNVGKKKRKKV